MIQQLPTQPKRNKPTVGILMYGSKQAGPPDTFRNLSYRQTQLIALGYNKALFSKHYYYGKN